MIVHNVKPGSDPWLELRLKHFTASEAPAMLGMSTYMTRNQLLDLKTTGKDKPVNEFTQGLYQSSGFICTDL